jgi:hypothetical protein
MYSGSTLTTYSGRLLGAHQKIDRIARKHIERLVPKSDFPSIRQILHFEGGNGPDAIKRKSPANDEPWHFIQPFDESDTVLIGLICEHYNELVVALRDKNTIKAAFEAAWLAHAVVDGLTPAHHYPYEEKLVELRGDGLESRDSLRNKLVLPGETRRHQIKNNWKMWGPKGLFTTHGAFECGVATIILPLKFKQAVPTEADLKSVRNLGVADWFRITAQEIASLELYDAFYAHGWTRKLARRVRLELAPRIVHAVTLVWHAAAEEAKHANH